jgi:hypothetical protein
MGILPFLSLLTVYVADGEQFSDVLMSKFVAGLADSWKQSKSHCSHWYE